MTGPDRKDRTGLTGGDTPVDEQGDDDQIIGRALRVSGLVLVALAALALVLWAILGREAEPELVEEAAPVPVQRLETAIDREPPLLPFTDVTEASGIDFVHTSGAFGERLLPETMGGGVAVFDFDRDGDQDLLFVDSARWPWRDDGPAGGVPRLYANRGDGAFDDVTAATGLDALRLYGMGVAVADVDGDGFRDVLLTAVGSNVFLRNVDGQRFEDVTEAAGLAGDATDWSSGAAFFDADADGDLDLFVASYVEWSRAIDQAVRR